MIVEYIPGNCCLSCVLEFHELNHAFTQIKCLASQKGAYSLKVVIFGFVLTASSGVDPEHHMLTSKIV